MTPFPPRFLSSLVYLTHKHTPYLFLMQVSPSSHPYLTMQTKPCIIRTWMKPESFLALPQQSRCGLRFWL